MFRYAAGAERLHEDDPVVKMAVDFVKGRIDDSIEKYEHSVAMGKRGGRPKKDESNIYEMAASGMSAAEIAEVVGRSKETIRKKDAFKMGQAAFYSEKAKDLGF
jgi:hypothetical protein